MSTSASPTVTMETPDQPEVLALLRQSEAFSAARYPPESAFQVDAAFLAGPMVRFLVARRDGRAIGCGALVLASDGTAEIRRMIVDGAARGQGVGRAILEALEAIARQEGVRTIRLETGPLNSDALNLYRRYGYRQRGPFGSYVESPHSVFMEKAIPS
jgi:putative acetyltransferase